MSVGICGTGSNEGSLHNILETMGHWFCFLSLFAEYVSTLIFFSFFSAELSVQFVHTVNANKLNDEVKRSTGRRHLMSCRMVNIFPDLSVRTKGL